MDKLLDELIYKVTIGPEGEHTLWEHKLKLWLKPKPSYIPDALWIKLVGLVLYQTKEII
jgi:hypothetical protein